MLTAVALICSITMPGAECTRATAVDVLTRPCSAPMECIMDAQAAVAQSAFARDIGHGFYVRLDYEMPSFVVAMIQSIGVALPEQINAR